MTRAKSDLAVSSLYLYRNFIAPSQTWCVTDQERYYVYVLLSLRDDKFYTGFTASLKERVQAHARGEVKSTKWRRPLTLIHYEYFVNKEDAEARERFLKSGFGRRQLKQALKRTLAGK